MSRNLQIVVQSVLALLLFVSIGAQFLASRSGAGFNAITFFSYFTNQIGILTAIILAISTIHLLQGKRESENLSLLRGSVLSYMVIVGVVFNFLLRESAYTDPLLVAWSAETLHSYIPLTLVVTYLVFPLKNRLSYKAILIWLIFPIVWLAYTYGRALLTGFYIYYFLDPNASGILGVAGYVLGITTAFAAVGSLVIFASNLLNSLTSSKSKAELI